MSHLGDLLHVLLILGSRLLGQPTSQLLLVTVVEKKKQTACTLAFGASFAHTSLARMSHTEELHSKWEEKCRLSRFSEERACML